MRSDLGKGRLIVLYDGDCGFCKVTLALLLRWDRARRLTPVAIQSRLGDELLVDVSPQDRLSSWHLIDRAGTVRSGGAGVPAIFAALPGGAMIARVAARFPRTTARAYAWIAGHRALLGRPLNARTRAWAAQVVADRARLNQVSAPRC